MDPSISANHKLVRAGRLRRASNNSAKSTTVSSSSTSNLASIVTFKAVCLRPGFSSAMQFRQEDTV